MMDAFLSGGVIMWPLLAVGVGVVVLTVRESLRAGRAAGSRSPGSSPDRTAGILFWGGTAAVLGLLGTVVGLLQMAEAIQRGGGATPQLIWGGVSLSLVSLIFGLLILLLAGAGWLVVRRLQRGSNMSGAAREAEA